jgi:hypothetical protein
LRPVAFRYTPEFLRKNPTVRDRVYHNFIAQEYGQVFPDAVQEAADGYLQLDTHDANVFLVRAVQELDARLRAERDEHAAMRAQDQQRLVELEARLAALEADARDAAALKSPGRLGVRLP